MFFAGYLVAKRDVLALAGGGCSGIDLPRARDLGPVLIAWGASLLVLVFESDIGTSALFFGLFVVMMYIATQRIVLAAHRDPAVRVRRLRRQRAVRARQGPVH